MKKSYSPNINSKSIQNNYKKLQASKNSDTNIKKNLSKKRNIQIYDEIIPRKNNYNTYRGQIKDSISNIMINENNINKMQIIRLEKNNFLKKLNSLGNKSAGFLSGNDFHFQPILTDISNISKNKEKSGELLPNGINNLNNYYKNLYQKTKNDNIKLLTKIKELQQKNINYEKIITKFQIERKNFINKIQELEIIINKYKEINSKREYNEKKEYNFSIEEKNKIIIENEKLKTEINKILNDLL